MTLTLEEVEHIATLARLELTAEEKERYRQQLSDILEYASRLQSLETSGVLPTSGIIPGQSTMREDASRPGLKREDLLQNAPEVENFQYRVPPVLE
jgi:aspartyl-tRNA(Asn)/glutamyl-tRNA(Gln) amidotransferase subunit C